MFCFGILLRQPELTNTRAMEMDQITKKRNQRVRKFIWTRTLQESYI